MNSEIGKGLIILGICSILVGTMMIFWKGSFSIGKLPGDIRIEGKSGSFYFPLTSCLLISATLSLIGWIFKNFNK
jgi:cell division protein FtsX